MHVFACIRAACIHATCIQVPAKAREDIGSPETEVASGREPPMLWRSSTVSEMPSHLSCPICRFLCVPHRPVNSTEFECIALDLVLLLTPKFEVVSQRIVKAVRRGFVYPPYTFYLSSTSHNYRAT